MSKEVASPYSQKRSQLPLYEGDYTAQPKLKKHTSARSSKKVDEERPREDISHAVDFLSSIDTGSVLKVEKIPNRRNSIKSSPNSPISILHENEDEWISGKGKRRRSFKKCIKPHRYRRLIVDLSPYPPVLFEGPVKDSLNEEFASLYPFLDSRLTLSTIVNMREKYIVLLCRDLDIEVCTVALAWTYFNKLLDWNCVTRYNRKSKACACILLAYKFIEEMTTHEVQQNLGRLISSLCEDESEAFKEATLREEFEVYSALRFDLHLPTEEFENIFDLILRRIESTREDYLGGLL